MSSDAEAGIPATVALFSILSTISYCVMAASVLFLYDTVITFDREVACFWTTKWSGASLLFFANKWISTTVFVFTFIQFVYFPSDKSCTSFTVANTAISILQFVPWAVFSALRAYVLSRSKPLGVFILSLSLAPVGANLVVYGYNFFGDRSLPLFLCGETDTMSAVLVLKLVIVSRAPLIVADILLLYVTWLKLSSRNALKDIRQSLAYRRRYLTEVLFHNGIIYFVVLFLLNALHLILAVTAMTSYGKGSQITEFTAPITAILVSRFLLELQEANRAIVRVDPDDTLHPSRNPHDDATSFISSLGTLSFAAPDNSVSHGQGSESFVDSYSDHEGGERADISQVQAAAESPARLA